MKVVMVVGFDEGGSKYASGIQVALWLGRVGMKESFSRVENY